MRNSLRGVQWNWYGLSRIFSQQSTPHIRAVVIRCAGLSNKQCGAIDGHPITKMRRLPEVQLASDIPEGAKEGSSTACFLLGNRVRLRKTHGCVAVAPLCPTTWHWAA